MMLSWEYVQVYVFVVVLLIVIRLLFVLCEEDDDDSEISHSEALFTLTKRLKRLYTASSGSRVYVGLRIPDLDSASPRNIDLLVVTYQQAIVISLNSVSGFVWTDKEGNWITKHHKTQSQWIPDPVAEAKESLTILQKYLERRGIALPEGYLSFKVICPNLKFGSIDADSFPPEVVTYDRWALLKSKREKSFSEGLKCIRSGGKEMQESFTKLNSILVTAPTWDRLELSRRYVLGEFIGLKGEQEDLQKLSKIRRSKTSRLDVGLLVLSIGPQNVHFYLFNIDYCTKGREGLSWYSQWEKIYVRASTEVLFQPRSSKEQRKYELYRINDLSLSASEK